MTSPSSEKRAKHRVMISGYYGFDNLGDELILETLLQELRKRDFTITVLSANPKKTRQRFGINAIHRLNVLDIVEEMTRTHLFISGGGGLFQDTTGPGSTLYYGGLIHMAYFFSVPVFFWGQGVGPLKNPLARDVTRRSLQRCNGITVRDEGSAALVEALIGEKPEVTADPVWMLKVPNKSGARKKYKSWNIGISLRPWPELTPQRITALAGFFNTLTIDSGRPVRFFLLPFQPEADKEPLTRFRDALEHEGITNTHWVEPEDIIKSVTKCHVVFGMRYHSLVLAMLGKVPVYGLVYDPKVQQLLDQVGLKGTGIAQLDTLEEEAVREYFNDYPEPNLKVLEARAALNLDRLLETYQHDVTETVMGLEELAE